MTASRVHDVVVVEPPKGWAKLGLRDVWHHRELLYFLAWRDLKVRYVQAAIGVAWAVVQPLLMMAVFTVFLGRIDEVRSDNIPYPVFAFAGLLPWTFFANAVGGATHSLVGSANLVSKVYFPRLVIPLAALLSWVPDLLIATGMLLGLMLIYGMTPDWPILLLPLFVLLAILVTASVGVWLSALNVGYRDIRYAVPFLLQLWLFATPVVYPTTLLPERWRVLAGLNPMAGVVEGFRWCVVHESRPPWALMGLSAVVATVVLIGGLFYFRRAEPGFADVI